MELNYLKDVQIDDQQLDVEWLNQADLAIRYGKAWADAKREHKQAEREMQQISAELIKLANTAPEKYLGAGTKATAANVQAFVDAHPKMKLAVEKLDEAVYTLDVADVARKEIGVTRKNALQAMTELLTANYFAGPSTPRNLQEIRAEQRKAATERIAKRFKREKSEEE